MIYSELTRHIQLKYKSKIEDSKIFGTDCSSYLESISINDDCRLNENLNLNSIFCLAQYADINRAEI